MTSPPHYDWLPENATLKRGADGIWHPESVSHVSYPEKGNMECYQVEENSFWFAHRNRCILAIAEKFAPKMPIYDVGGGNGYVAHALQNAGFQVVLVEPGLGATNAIKRGIHNVVQAALHDCGFEPGALSSMAAFDVVEHIEDDLGFLKTCASILSPGGLFLCTVPAYPLLWSNEDFRAGHHRRYTPQSLRKVFEMAGFQVEYLTHIFSWMPPPLFALRTLGSLFKKMHSRVEQGTIQHRSSDHRLPRVIQPLVNRIHSWELQRIQQSRTIFTGTSLLCVAKRSESNK